MRLAYLDAFAGISGDMLLGAFVHAGVSMDLLRQNLVRLDLGAEIKIEEVNRSGIHSVKVTITKDGKPVEQNGQHHNHHHHHDEDVRSLEIICQLIERASLPKPVTRLAIRAFELLGEAESKVHGLPIAAIHFHEVGAVDAIADIVLAATAAHALGIDAWHCSPLNVGGGTVQCAHGRYPVPAPAVAELLLGLPTYSDGIAAELVTPTGAALIRALGCAFNSAPPMTVDAIGYGAGTRNPPGFANVLRLSIGESSAAEATAESVLVIEAALDDLNPQVMAYVTEHALKLGALDAMLTPVFMKKNRSGTLLTVLSDRIHAPALQELILRETSTLGLRIREERRICLERRHVSVSTKWGAVRVKVGYRGERVMNVAPEFEDCRAVAESLSVPVKRVLEAAVQGYRRDHP